MNSPEDASVGGTSPTADAAVARPVESRPLGAISAGADTLAVQAARRPLRSLAVLLACNAVLAAAFVAVGLGLVGDQAELFRELHVGTWLSFGQLLFISAVARGLHWRDGPERRWYLSFWGLSAAIFLVFAFDEITQSAIFLGQLLERGFGVAPAAGFHDLEAVLLTLLFCGAAMLLLPRARVLLRHPLALGLLGVAALLGAVSQTLDSIAPATRWEFVAEESLKLGAEVFFIGGFAAALHGVLKRRGELRE